mmetsp:Transcript_24037/g.36536  ORF Transcript_24037/g.36536 Transcript_24037/m.36536 type:complete len:183 (-) Transcript_24037:553-1101(-)
MNFVNPVTTSPTSENETAAVERSPPQPGGEDCNKDSDCLSGVCRKLDSKCEDDFIIYSLFLTFGDIDIDILIELIDNQSADITESVANALTDQECERLEGETCADRSIQSVNLTGSYNPSSGIFNGNLSSDAPTAFDECDANSRFIDDIHSQTTSIPKSNDIFNTTTDPTSPPVRLDVIYTL